MGWDAAGEAFALCQPPCRSQGEAPCGCIGEAAECEHEEKGPGQ